jgi:phosphoribosylglycinamide formyltransferase-1
MTQTVIERIGWLTSARDRAAVDLLNAILVAGVRPTLVACCPQSNNRRFVEPILHLCEKFDVPQLIFEPVKGRSPLEHDEKLWSELSSYNCSKLFLVGYMRLVTPELLARAQSRFINLHPATPTGPVGKWEDVVWSLIRNQATETGGMLHITTEIPDRGPVISYYAISIAPHDNELAPLWLRFTEKLQMKTIEDIVEEEGINEPLFAAIRKRQFEREAPLLIITLRRLLDGTLRIVRGGVMIDSTFSPNGVCLNDEVEVFLAEQHL